MRPLSPRDLMTVCLRSFLEGEVLFRLPSWHLALSSKWDRIARLADEEGVAGILCDVLCESDVPVSSHSLLSQSARTTFRRNGLLWHLLTVLGKRFEDRSIPAVLLKGTALLIGPYGMRFSLRPMSDLDILIRPRDRRRVVGVLTSLGLASESRQSNFFANSQTAVDLHFDLIGCGRIQSRREAFRFPTQDVWQAAKPVDGLPPFLVPSSEHQFLHLSVHALKHTYLQLVWLIDLALVWQECRPEAVCSSAERFGLERPLLYSLTLLRDLLGTSGLDGLIARLPKPNRLERHFLRSVRQRRTEDLGALVTVFSVNGTRNRWGYLRESAFPRRRILSEVYPETPFALAVLKRSVHLGLRGLDEFAKGLFQR